MTTGKEGIEELVDRLANERDSWKTIAERLAEALRDLLHHGCPVTGMADPRTGEPIPVPYQADPDKAKESLAAHDAMKDGVAPMESNPTPAPRKEGPAKVISTDYGFQVEIHPWRGLAFMSPNAAQENADRLNKALAPLLARAECAEKLSEALSKIVGAFDKAKFDYEMAEAMKKGLYEEAESALAAWDSIKKDWKV